MFENVEAELLCLGRGAQADGRADDAEHDPGSDQHENGNRHHADQLRNQLVQPTAMEETGLGHEQADGQGAPDATKAMHGHSADHVIDLHAFQRVDTDVHDNTANGANDNGLQRGNDGAGRRDGHQSGERAIQTPGELWLATMIPADKHGYQCAGRSREIGGDRDARDADGVGIQLTAGVEAKPAEPEDQGAERGQGHAVAGHGATGPTEAVGARTEEDRAGPDPPRPRLNEPRLSRRNRESPFRQSSRRPRSSDRRRGR